MAYFTKNDEYKYKTPYKMMAKFADGQEFYFYGKNETDCENSINDRIDVHGEVVYYHGVTDENYVDGKRISHQNDPSDYAEIEEDKGSYFDNSYQEPKDHAITLDELYSNIESMSLLNNWMCENHYKLWKRVSRGYSIWDGKDNGKWKYTRSSAVKTAGCVFDEMLKERFNEEHLREDIKNSGLKKVLDDFEAYINLGKDLNALDDNREVQIRNAWNDLINNLIDQLL